MSQQEREAVAEALRVHATDGRLSFDELDQRLGECLSATTYDQLRRVLADLPPTRDPRAATSSRWAGAVVPAVMIVALITIGIGVLLTGHAFPFIPLVPLGAFAVLVARKGPLSQASRPPFPVRAPRPDSQRR